MSMRLTRTHSTPRVAAALLLGAVLLAGCGGEDPTVSTTSESTSETSPSESADAGAGQDEVRADHNEADTTFAQMMIPHHRQAIEMSDMVLAKEGVDTRVVALAEGIKAAQEPEIEDLTGFLQAWGEEEAGEGMMGNDAMGGQADGMMSAEDMGMMQDSEGADAGRLFLEQMIMHHTSAVEMAQAEVDSGQNPQAIELAGAIVAAQQAEITEMQDLLATL
jgi:uncharacterized protein (DUF305 family)